MALGDVSTGELYLQSEKLDQQHNNYAIWENIASKWNVREIISNCDSVEISNINTKISAALCQYST